MIVISVDQEEEDAEGVDTQQKHQEAGLVLPEETGMEVVTIGQEATVTTVLAAKYGTKEKQLESLFF